MRFTSCPDRVFVSIFLGLILLSSCSDNSNSPTENRPPATPQLVAPADGAVALPTAVTLLWEKGTDPDGDSLSYALYVDRVNPPNRLLAAEFSSAEFVLSALSQSTSYYWRVIAADEKSAASPSSPVFRFTVGSFEFGWSELSPMPTPRLGPAAAVSGNRLFVIGGQSDVGTFDVVEAYDPLTDSWSELTAMPSRRTHTCAVENNGVIYVLGGESANVPQTLVESYNPLTDHWTQLEPLPSPRTRSAAAVANGKIYVFGGFQSNKAIDVYDIAFDNWQQIAELPQEQDGMSVTFYEGRFYIIGGSKPDDFWLRDVTVYDPLANSLTVLEQMPTARRDHRASLIDGKIYVTGGFNAASGHKFFGSVEVYDIANNSWLTRSRMNTARHDHAAGAINGKLYVTGGLTDKQPDILGSLEVYDPLIDN